MPIIRLICAEMVGSQPGSCMALRAPSLERILVLWAEEQSSINIYSWTHYHFNLSFWLLELARLSSFCYPPAGVRCYSRLFSGEVVVAPGRFKILRGFEKEDAGGIGWPPISNQKTKLGSNKWRFVDSFWFFLLVSTGSNYRAQKKWIRKKMNDCSCKCRITVSYHGTLLL